MNELPNRCAHAFPDLAECCVMLYDYVWTVGTKTKLGSRWVLSLAASPQLVSVTPQPVVQGFLCIAWLGPLPFHQTVPVTV